MLRPDYRLFFIAGSPLVFLKSGSELPDPATRDVLLLSLLFKIAVALSFVRLLSRLTPPVASLWIFGL